jgi:hypothetical protein
VKIANNKSNTKTTSSAEPFASVTGTVFAIGKPETRGTFTKQEIAVELTRTSDAGNVYTNYIVLQATRDAIAKLKALKLSQGDPVTARYCHRGKVYTNPEGETTIFNNLEILDIIRANA